MKNAYNINAETSKINKTSSKFQNVRQGTLNRFYTNKAIGEILVKLIDIVPNKIIDLGAGEGSLSSAAGKNWNNADIVTVDIDKDCEESLSKNIKSSGNNNHIHHVYNVLDSSLTLHISNHGHFDLAVCNPPFYKPEWNNDFMSILRHADMLHVYRSKTDITAEVLFLAQNLRLIRNGGTIALIIPDGILTGYRNKSLRKHLLSKHRIDCVLQLPRHAFSDTEARCFVLILTKNEKQSDKVKLLKYDSIAGLSEPLFIETTEAIQRLDYEYHVNNIIGDSSTKTLRQLGAEINRGSISSAEVKSATFPVFHTSHYNSSESGRITFSSVMPNIKKDKLIIAEPGDILMARVDRNLHKKIAMVIDGSAVLTDCVYRIRLPSNFREAAFQALISDMGSSKIQAASKGVGARLIGKADLLDLPLNI